MCHLDRSPRKKYEGRVEKRYTVMRTKKGNGGMKDRVDRSSKTRGMTTLIENSPVETELVLVVLNILNS